MSELGLMRCMGFLGLIFIKSNMRTLIGTAIFAIVIGTSANVFGQKIEIGMTKQQLAKAYPRYDSAFKTPKQFTNVENFRVHGLRGLAIFHFSNDRLILFDWTYPNDYHPGAMLMMQPEEVYKYSTLVRELQIDYGPGVTKPSAYNQDAMNCDWNTPKYSGSCRLSPFQAKVQLMDVNAVPH